MYNAMEEAKYELIRCLKEKVPYVVTEKLDGSLGILYYFNHQWNLATRGSFDSDQAKEGEKILQKYDMSWADPNHTLLVEIIYPENKIVINYGDERKLVLLAVIDSQKQEELSRMDVETLSYMTGMPLVEEYSHTINEMIELQQTLPKEREGFVVRFESGLRVKIKGSEYMRIHKLISHMSPIAFWESMKDGKVQIDYLEELPEEYRADAEVLTQKLEKKYQTIKDQVLYEIDLMHQSGIWGSTEDQEFRKKVGLYIKNKKPLHGGAFFPHLLNKQDGLDKYIMKKLRPTGNILI